jgi:hypothetical protein
VTTSLTVIKPPGTAGSGPAAGRRGIIFAGVAFLLGSATSASPAWARPFDGTSAALPAFAQGPNTTTSRDGSASRRIGDAKRLSGLTWDELSRVMTTTRRTLHLWANGRPISSVNEGRLSRLVGLLQIISRGTGRETRQVLLTPLQDGLVPLDLLILGKFDDVAARLGRDRPVPTRIVSAQSTSRRPSRRPSSPIEMLDAMQDPIGVTLQTPLPGKVVRRPISRA